MKIPLFPAKMAAGALGSFGVLALVLAAVGIYGVMSYVVAGRTREIGLRMALGARTGNVQRLILRQGMTLAVIGSVIGLGIAFGATRLLKSVLKRSTAFAKGENDYVKMNVARRLRDAICDCEVPRRLRGSG